MLVDGVVLSAIATRYGFWKRKMGYAGKVLALILLMNREELVKRWHRGEAEHGKMTDKEFFTFDAWENLREEIRDGFWYSEIANEQERLYNSRTHGN